MDIAARIRTERERLGLSQEKLAQRMGLDRNTLWHIEAGRTKNPRADHIIALAKAFDVSADYLLGLTDDRTPARRARRPRSAKEVATLVAAAAEGRGWR
jgi:transcriptional regulator with XRE-family HTH domain